MDLFSGTERSRVCVICVATCSEVTHRECFCFSSSVGKKSDLGYRILRGEQVSEREREREPIRKVLDW